MFCSKCGQEISNGGRFCPNCGEPNGSMETPPEKSGGFKRIHLILILVACCLILVSAAVTALVMHDSEDGESAVEKGAAVEATGPEATGVDALQEEGNVPVEKEENDAYLWPTDRYPIGYEDLAGYAREGVAAIRNEIYARHGYIFKTAQWSEYFSHFSWYEPNEAYSDALLNFMEKSNLETIIAYEKDMGWRDSGTPAAAHSSALGGTLWPSDRYYITNEDLAWYTRDEVAAIRNEIYARHGYVFKKQTWRDYFSRYSWYQPNAGYSDALLSDLERANIDTIVKYEQSMGWN